MLKAELNRVRRRLSLDFTWSTLENQGGYFKDSVRELTGDPTPGGLGPQGPKRKVRIFFFFYLMIFIFSIIANLE